MFKRVLMPILLIAASGCQPGRAFAQASAETDDGCKARLMELSQKVANPFLKKEIELSLLQLGKPSTVPSGGAPAPLSAARIEELAAALSSPGAAPFASCAFVYFPVQAMSGIMRVPSVLPSDAQPGNNIEVIAAPGEFEPASFVIYPFGDVEKLELKTSDLSGKAGRIPSSSVDIRIVKCWYQGHSAWHRYVPTYGWPWVLTPELLLHDESLIKVTVETNRHVTNYIRVDWPEGPEYMWVREHAQPGAPAPKLPSKLFPEVFPVRDSPVLLPATLTRNETKQFWITVRVPDDQPAGVYSGEINLSADGQPLPPIKLSVRVLPFKLPMPKTYYDSNKDFYAAFMGGGRLRGASEKEPGPNTRTEAQLLAEFKNRLEHNDYHALVHIQRRYLELRKEAGLDIPPLINIAGGVESGLFFERGKDGQKEYDIYRKNVSSNIAMAKEIFGHHDVFIVGLDEAPRWHVRRQVPFWRIAQEEGARVYATGDDSNFLEAGHVQDWLNRSGRPSGIEAAKWHNVGGIITMYAAPFAGAENPHMFRLCHGLILYKSDYDGSSNYILYEKRGGFVWDEYYPDDYRSFCVVYPTIDGLIDTLAWEGYREAIDDVKYATLMKTLAEEALRGSDIKARRIARRALHWFETCPVGDANLDAVRRKMIEYILELKGLAPLEAS